MAGRALIRKSLIRMSDKDCRLELHFHCPSDLCASGWVSERDRVDGQRSRGARSNTGTHGERRISALESVRGNGAKFTDQSMSCKVKGATRARVVERKSWRMGVNWEEVILKDKG